MSRTCGKNKTRATLLGWLTLALVSGLPGVAAAGITASLQHTEIPLDRATRLMVSLSGSSTGQPAIPAVPGLRFTPTGTSSQMQYVNGQVSSIVTYTFHVQAEKTGDFTIPAITATIDGKSESTAPIRLRVVPAAGSAPQSPNPRQSGVPGPRVAPKPLTRESVDEEAAFLELETRKGRLYMGEMVPVAINAYFRDGLGVSVAPPRLEGDAFVLHNLNEEPERSRVQLDGRLYTKLTWNSAISAIKEGRYPIKARLDATIQMPAQRSSRSRPFGHSMFDDDFFGGSFFNDDFFDQFFGGVEERPIALATKPHRIRVKPLPREGRPADFSGAVGQFKLSANAKPTKAAVGDPITLTMTVRGTGNFDRVTAPVLAADEGWKTYDPGDAFKGADGSGYRGRKRFEQAIVPQRADLKAIPPVRFTYFDTHSKRYETLVTNPIPIELSGAQPFVHVTHASPAGNTVQVDARFVPIYLEAGRRTSLEPLATQPWFLGLQTLPLGALVLGLLLHRRHAKTAARPEWALQRAMHRKVSESLRDADTAVRQNDAAGFIHASRNAIREQLAVCWQLRAEAITLAEFNARLPEGFDGIRRVFQAADVLAYSGQSFQSSDLDRWHREVLSELEALTDQQTRGER